jgi:hypothetical protein
MNGIEASSFVFRPEFMWRFMERLVGLGHGPIKGKANRFVARPALRSVWSRPLELSACTLPSPMSTLPTFP